MKILVVDDDTDLLELSVMMLEEKGYIVESATSGNQALKKLREKTFDLVLSDVRMDDGDGIFLLEEIRKVNQRIPIVILVTGYSSVSNEEMIKKGVNAIFSKPVSYEDIIVHIEKLKHEMT